MESPKIADGLWQLKIPMESNSLGYTCSYLLVDAATLIDTGVGTERGSSALALVEQLKKAGFKVSDIERLIITHLHRDHIGLVSYIKSVSDAKVYAHERAAEALKIAADLGDKNYDARKEIEMLGGKEFLRSPDSFSFPLRQVRVPFQVDEVLIDGDILALKGSKLNVIWTPGHAPEHMCLYDADRHVLFSGDHVLPRVTSHISLHVYEDSDPLRDYLNSLEKLVGLSVDLVLPGHEHIFKNLNGRIEELKNHHEKRCGEIKEALRKGERTVLQISSQISWESCPWPLMPFWIKRMALAETLAHLVHLRNKGEVKVKLSQGVLYYSGRA